MNAIVAKADAASWPSQLQQERQESPGFWTFRVAGVACSAHRLGTATIGGQSLRLWLVHAPRAVLRGLRDQDGIFVKTLKELAQSANADDIAARLGVKTWLVNGTYDGRAVTNFPWTFAGPVQTGVDGLMTVSALVRPLPPALVNGDPEDYDGAEATL